MGQNNKKKYDLDKQKQIITTVVHFKRGRRKQSERERERDCKERFERYTKCILLIKIFKDTDKDANTLKKHVE